MSRYDVKNFVKLLNLPIDLDLEEFVKIANEIINGLIESKTGDLIDVQFIEKLLDKQEERDDLKEQILNQFNANSNETIDVQALKGIFQKWIELSMFKFYESKTKNLTSKRKQALKYSKHRRETLNVYEEEQNDEENNPLDESDDHFTVNEEQYAEKVSLLNNLQIVNDQLECENVELKHLHGRVKEQLITYEETNLQLENDLQSLTKKLSHLERLNRELNVQLSNSTNSNTELKRVIDEINTVKGNLETENVRLNRDLKESLSKLDSLNCQLASVSQQLKITQKSFDSEKNISSDQRERIETLTDQLDRLSSELEQKTHSVNRLVGVIEILKAENKSLNEKVEKLELQTRNENVETTAECALKDDQAPMIHFMKFESATSNIDDEDFELMDEFGEESKLNELDLSLVPKNEQGVFMISVKPHCNMMPTFEGETSHNELSKKILEDCFANPVESLQMSEAYRSKNTETETEVSSRQDSPKTRHDDDSNMINNEVTHVDISNEPLIDRSLASNLLKNENESFIGCKYLLKIELVVLALICTIIVIMILPNYIHVEPKIIENVLYLIFGDQIALKNFGRIPF